MRKEPAALGHQAADAYCRFLTRRHYENFSVASRFVDAATRRDLTRIYAYCRTTDDLGDESPPGTAPARLARWREAVLAMLDGAPPVDPVLVVLAETIARRAIPAAPFLDLIEANLRDQQVSAYATWPDLIGYCRLSAAPVGRMVLRVFGVADPRAEALADDVCIGLQLANHAQDVSRDRMLGRTYLVDADLRAGGTTGAVRAMVERARALLDSGRELETRVPAPLRMQLALYRLGGLAICRAIAGMDYATESRRPHVAGAAKLAVLLAAARSALAANPS